MHSKVSLFVASAALLAALPAAEAQVDISCRLQHARVLQYEPVLVLVTLRNRTAEPMVFQGETDGPELAFAVERSPGRPVRRTERPMLDEPLTVPPWESVAVEIDLVSRYDFRDQGPYTIAAMATFGGEVFASGRLFLDILPGLEMYNRRVSLSQTPGGRRLLSLRTLSRDRRETLFLRMDDEDKGLCFGAFELGTVVRMFPPAMEIDAEDRIHVLHQSAPARYTRTIIRADGLPLDQEFFSPAGPRPELVVEAGGRISVTGVRPYTGDPVVDPGRFDSRRDRR